MKKIMKAIRKNWIRLWLIAVIILSVGVLATYAAYTEVQSVKRVVSTWKTSDVLFSSNNMKLASKHFMRRLSSTESTIMVFNYDYENQKSFNETDIQYTFKAWLVGPDGKRITNDNISSFTIEDLEEKIAKYTVWKSYDNRTGELSSAAQHFTAGNNYTVTIPENVLKGGEKNEDGFRVTIDPAAMGLKKAELFLHVEAEPGNTMEKLDALLYGQQREDDDPVWKGKITDQDYQNREYDFYNYVISGSGEGTIDIKWNPEKIEINPFFYTSGNYVFLDGDGQTVNIVTPAPIEDGWKKITLVVGSPELERQENRYELQIFKTGEPEESYDDIDKYIKSEFKYSITEDTNAENDNQTGG